MKMEIYSKKFDLKKFKIDNLALSFSEYYPSHNYDVDPIYWFCLSNYKVYDGEELIEKGVFKSGKELMSSDDYIPYAKSDVTQAEKDFMELFCVKEKAELEQIRVTHPDCNGDYDIAFRIFLENHPLRAKWDDFSENRLLNDVIAWCKLNQINYRVKF